MRTLYTILVAAALVGCSGDAFESNDVPLGGSSGEAGSAGAGGTSGQAGSGGLGGASGQAGSGGEAGQAGSGGQAGEAGSGGIAGSAGSGGSGGVAGQAGSGGGGASGQAGSGGTPGDPDGAVVVANLDDPAGIAVDDTRVFWSQMADGEILTASLSNGATTTLATGQNHPRCLIEDGDTIYWANFHGGSIQSVKKNGTGLLTVGAGAYPTHLAQNSTHIFWTNAMGTAIQYSEKANPQVGSLPVSGGYPDGIHVVGQNVYWTSGTDVRHYDMSTSTDYIVATNEVDPGDITSDGTWMYWIERGSGYDSSEDQCTAVTGKIKAARLADYTDVKTIATDQACPLDIQADGGSLYWVNRGTFNGVVYQDNGSIMKDDGSGPEIAAAGQRRPFNLDVNSDVIVWTSLGMFVGQGTIRQIAR